MRNSLLVLLLAATAMATEYDEHYLHPPMTTDADYRRPVERRSGPLPEREGGPTHFPHSDSPEPASIFLMAGAIAFIALINRRQ